MADEVPETKEEYLQRRLRLMLDRQIKDATARATDPNAKADLKHMRIDVYARPIT